MGKYFVIFENNNSSTATQTFFELLKSKYLKTMI